MPTLRVKEIWRYPVKSMQGEKLDHCVVSLGGIPLDRGWAVRDEETKTIRGAKYLAGLLNLSARYVEGTSAGLVPHVEIATGREKMRSDDPSIHDFLSAALGRNVTLRPLKPADETEPSPKRPAMNLAELRAVFGLEPGEPMPDFSAFPPQLMKELMELGAPRGTYFDAYPVHVLSEGAVAHLQTLTPESRLDVRRFRPNFLIAKEGGPNADPTEESWLGREVALGTSTIKPAVKTPRCIMTTRAQMELPQDSAIMRAMVRATAQCLGVYADVVRAGTVSVGSEVIAA
jgi:uncharacterized protein YcbX